MNKIIYFFFLLIYPVFLQAQAEIYGSIDGIDSKSNVLYLKENIGGKYYTIDSCLLNHEGAYQFSSPSKTGLYSLFLSDTNWVQIIIDTNESVIHINFASSDLRKSIHIIQSKENQLLWDFIFYRKQIQHQISQNYIKKTYFQKGSIEYKYFQKIEDSLNLNFDRYIWALYQKHQPSFFANTIVSDIKSIYQNDYFLYIDSGSEPGLHKLQQVIYGTTFLWTQNNNKSFPY
jgi:hypothetical protein